MPSDWGTRKFHLPAEEWRHLFTCHPEREAYRDLVFKEVDLFPQPYWILAFARMAGFALMVLKLNRGDALWVDMKRRRAMTLRGRDLNSAPKFIER